MFAIGRATPSSCPLPSFSLCNAPAIPSRSNRETERERGRWSEATRTLLPSSYNSFHALHIIACGGRIASGKKRNLEASFPSQVLALNFPPGGEGMRGRTNSIIHAFCTAAAAAGRARVGVGGDLENKVSGVIAPGRVNAQKRERERGVVCVTEAGALLRTLSAHEAQASLIHVPPQVLTSCSHPPKLYPLAGNGHFPFVRRPQLQYFLYL